MLVVGVVIVVVRLAEGIAADQKLLFDWDYSGPVLPDGSDVAGAEADGC